MNVKLTKEQRQLIVEDIQTFFYNERDEEISQFAAKAY